jgi:hypothetical protein
MQHTYKRCNRRGKTGNGVKQGKLAFGDPERE